MSKRKGVSADEKRARMLQLFYEKKEFFQLKELEKIAPKEKGIVAQSVKDVVQGLVDEGLVDTDKIGGSVYFWAFPSKSFHVKRQQIANLQQKLEESNTKLKEIMEKLSEAKVGREESKERYDLLDDINKLETEKENLLKEIQKYKENDPEVYEQMKQDATRIKEAANRWTDNVFSLRTWCRNKFNIETSVLDKQFEIPADFDYVP